jgi:hypothetical protein
MPIFQARAEILSKGPSKPSYENDDISVGDGNTESTDTEGDEKSEMPESPDQDHDRAKIAGESSDESNTEADTEAEEQPTKFDLYSSFYGSSTETFYGSVGGTIAARGNLDESGLRIGIHGVAGGYQYKQRPSRRLITGNSEQVDFLLGYGWVTENTEFSISVGPDYQHNSVLVSDPHNKTIGSFWGAKASTEFSTNPTEETSLSFYGSFSSANHAYYGNIKTGYAILPELFIGPEISFLGNQFYDQMRFGGYVGGIQIGSFELELSAGYEARFRHQNDGIYGLVSFSILY